MESYIHKHFRVFLVMEDDINESAMSLVRFVVLIIMQTYSVIY